MYVIIIIIIIIIIIYDHLIKSCKEVTIIIKESVLVLTKFKFKLESKYICSINYFELENIITYQLKYSIHDWLL